MLGLPRSVMLRTQFILGAACGLALFGSLFGTTQVASAGDPTEKEKEAQKLFLEGRDALARGENEIACVKFRGSLALFPVANTRANVAQCDEKEGKWIAALNTWKGLLPELPEGDPRRVAALGRIEALEAKIPKLTLTLPSDFPREAKVTLDGAAIETAKWTEPMLLVAGEHVVVVEVLGRKEQRFVVTLAEGEKKNLPIHAAPAPSATGAPSVSATAPPPPPGMSTQRIAGIAVGGLGIASLIAAGITGGMIISQDGEIQKQCQPGTEPGTKLCTPQAIQLIRDGEAGRVANGVFFGVGLAALGAGVVLYLTGGSAAPKAALTPFVHPYGGGATLTGRF